MTRLLLTAAIAAAVVLPSAADAASYRHKRHGAHYYGRTWNRAPVRLYRGYGGYGWQGPSRYTSGPRWAAPNQCFEDLGYGRYESCDW
jgi:hypothetical protein